MSRGQELVAALCYGDSNGSDDYQKNEQNDIKTTNELMRGRFPIAVLAFSSERP